MAFSAACASVTVCGGYTCNIVRDWQKNLQEGCLRLGGCEIYCCCSCGFGADFMFLYSSCRFCAWSYLRNWGCLSEKKETQGFLFLLGVCLAIASYFWIVCGVDAVRAYLRISQQLAEKFAK